MKVYAVIYALSILVIAHKENGLKNVCEL